MDSTITTQDMNKTRYTHRDYESIKSDLIDAIPSLTQEWTSTEESDPGIVLIKLISMFGDTLSYNVDKIALELYLKTVTQRKNCSMILSLLGYKMRWYRAPRVVANVKLQVSEYENNPGTEVNPRHVILTPFVTSFTNGNLNYAVVPSATNQGPIDIYSDTEFTNVYLIEGTVVTVTFNRDSLKNNRYYFPYNNVDEEALWLTFGVSHTCNLVDNLYLVTDDQAISFEFNVDEYDNPYIELINYWEDIIGSTAQSDTFTLRYVVTQGSQGNVSRNQLIDVVNSDNRNAGPQDLIILHPSNNFEDLEGDDGWTRPGYDAQTVEDARKDAAFYVTTYDTLVTPADFERAARRVVGMTGSRLIDNEIIMQNDLDIEEIANRAKDKFETQEVVLQEGQEPITLLKAHTAIVYLTYLNLGSNVNYYCNISESDPYKFATYEDFISAEPSEELKALGCFPYKPTNNIIADVNELYRETQIINVQIDYGTTKVYPFKVSGTLYLMEPLSPEETLTILSEIDANLEEYYYPDNHEFGEPPKFLDIVRVVQNTNTKINYFDAANQMIIYLPPCNGLEGFDMTSFAIYTGLDDTFNLAPQFLKFRIKNLSVSTVILEQLNEVSGEYYTILGQSYLTVQLKSVQELRALYNDMQLNTSIVYAG